MANNPIADVTLLLSRLDTITQPLHDAPRIIHESPFALHVKPTAQKEMFIATETENWLLVMDEAK